jgi:hypothetical protein
MTFSNRSPASGKLAEHAESLRERDALYHSGLRQARNLVESAAPFRNADPGYWAELMNVAAELRKFAVRRRNNWGRR